MKEAKEIRVLPNSNIEVRSSDDGKVVVRGYAAVFNSESEDLGGFVEEIEPGFFDEVLSDDVRALINHDQNMVLGRTTAGTLRIGQDERGLWYEYDDPNTTYSADLVKSMQRGDVTQSSFGFIVRSGGARMVEEKRDGRTMFKRILKKGGAERLFDVSPVTYPAYPDTTVAKRSLEAITKEQERLIVAVEQGRMQRHLFLKQKLMQL